MEKRREKLFSDYFSSIFGSSNVFTEKEYGDASAQFEINYGNFMPPQRDSKILDIGCGTGHFLYYLKKKEYNNFLGIDVSIQQVNFCRENVSEHVERADVFEFLKDKKAIFDVIIANDLLEHIPKEGILKFLDLVHEGLKSEGIFLIKTPNLGNPFTLYLRYKDFTHEAGFTDKSLYQVLWTAGFRNIQVKPFKRHMDRSFKRFVESRLAHIIVFILIKLFQIQGFVAPKILTPLLLGIAKK